MPKELTWSDSEDIGILLSETHPNSTRSRSVSPTCISTCSRSPDFKDDPAKSNEAKLEAIQMACDPEVLDRTQG